MRKNFLLGLVLSMLCSCSYFSDRLGGQEAPVLTDADYADYAKNVTVAAQGDNFVVYEYKNIRVDDLAVLAALYCNDHNSTRAYIDNITLYHNNARRAKFMCR